MSEFEGLGGDGLEDDFDINSLIDDSEGINFAEFDVNIQLLPLPQPVMEVQKIPQNLQVGQKRTNEQTMPMPSLGSLVDVTAKQNKQWPKLLGEFPIQFIQTTNIKEGDDETKYKLFIESGNPSQPDMVIVQDSKKRMIGYFQTETLFPLIQAKLISITIKNVMSLNCFVEIFIPKTTFIDPPFEETNENELKNIKNGWKRLFDSFEKEKEKETKRLEDDDDDLDDQELDDEDLDDYINISEEQKENMERDQQLKELYEAVTQSMEDNSEENQIDVPKDLKCDLREYQKTALRWMLNREIKGNDGQEKKLHPLYLEKKFQDGTLFYFNPFGGILTLTFIQAPPDPKGGILADEMGLGKTVEMLALFLANKSKMSISKYNQETGKYDTGSTLVVCPLTLVDQWKNEVEKYTPFKAYIYQGSRRFKEASKLINFDVIITTYNTLSFEYSQLSGTAKKKGKSDTYPLYQLSFWRVVLDEAHNIKNRKSLQSLACAAIDAPCRWAVTGTPIHNHIDDLFSLFQFIKVHPHGDWRYWSKYIAKPFEKKNKDAIHALQSVMSEVLIRRTKNKKVNGEKIIKLPDKTINIVNLEFSKEERYLYDLLYEFSKGKFEEFLKSGTVLKNYANILEMLQYLRQLCDHPALILYSFYNKTNKDTLRSFLINFTQYPDYKKILPSLEKVLENENVHVENFIEKYWVGSSKTNALVESLNKIKHITKSVIFSQWTSMLDLVEIALDKGDIHFVRLDGKMVRKDRDNAIQVFKNDDKIRCCLFSLKAGGVGLNLVWATHVYLLDPWWNPSIEDQAINRVHRIGQERDVVVNRFIIKNTIENRIMSLQRNKTALAQGLGMSDGGIEEMSFGMTKKDLQQIRLEDLKLMFDDVNHSDDEYESEDFDE